MGKTQKHQSKDAANLHSQQDSSADCADGDYVTLATVRELSQSNQVKRSRR